MNPIAFNLFGFDIRWYGILISIGILLGLVLAQFQCKYYEEDFDKVTDIFLVGLPLAIIGARLHYVLFSFDYYSQNPMQILNIRGGGLAIHGGIIGAAFAGFFMSKIKKMSFPRLLDIIAPSFLLGQTIGRWGNFMNSEAHGGPVTEQFISKFPEFIQKGMFINGTYYHPTFLYESVWNFIGLIILVTISRKAHNLKKGGIFAIYLVYYSIGRFFIEGMRTDQLTMGTIPIAQLISVLCIIGGLAFLLLGNKPKSKYHL